MLSLLMEGAEKQWLPDGIIRLGMRKLIGRRLREEQARWQKLASPLVQMKKAMGRSPIAIHTRQANEQHYELPTEFFLTVLGERLKYSSCYWPEGVDSLDDAEQAMLALTVERAQIRDGHDVLELGCGWGTLSLWIAEHFPHSNVLAVSNSHDQRRFIQGVAAQKGLKNLHVETCDMNDFDPGKQFDRVVSCEMFEHMRNWKKLLGRVENWLTPEGKLFIHIFVHRELGYFFETEGAANWMGRYFFTGGMMPPVQLLPSCADGFELDSQWEVDGIHYSKTLEAWLQKMDHNRAKVMEIFNETYGEEEAERWFQRWRMFFMASSELFLFNDRQEWRVEHYLFSKKA